MKITRYFQSCLLVEESGARILVDPSGNDAGKDFGKLDAVLYTHEHSDHFDPSMAEQFMAVGVVVYANVSTSKHMKSQPTIISDGDEFHIGQVSVRVHELPHCLMVNGSEGPQNSGYLLGGKLFHPGDGTSIEGIKAEILAAPISGPDVSLRDAYALAIQVAAKMVIPIHYDFIGTKPERFVLLAGNPPFETVILEPGVSTEI